MERSEVDVEVETQVAAIGGEETPEGGVGGVGVDGLSVEMVGEIGAGNGNDESVLLRGLEASSNIGVDGHIAGIAMFRGQEVLEDVASAIGEAAAEFDQRVDPHLARESDMSGRKHAIGNIGRRAPEDVVGHDGHGKAAQEEVELIQDRKSTR